MHRRFRRRFLPAVVEPGYLGYGVIQHFPAAGGFPFVKGAAFVVPAGGGSDGHENAALDAQLFCEQGAGLDVGVGLKGLGREAYHGQHGGFPCQIFPDIAFCWVAEVAVGQDDDQPAVFDFLEQFLAAFQEQELELLPLQQAGRGLPLARLLRPAAAQLIPFQSFRVGNGQGRA